MKIIDEREILINHTLPKNTAFLDMETDGFSHKKNSILGFSLCQFYSYDTARLSQYFSSNEVDVIENLINSLIGIDEVVTFGGDSFEKKFILEKLNSNPNLKVYGMDMMDELIFSDMQISCRCFALYFELESFSRSVVEKAMRIKRPKSYDMKSIVKGVRSKDDNSLIEMVNHSRSEILTLIKIYHKIENHKLTHKIKIKKDTYLMLDRYLLESEKLSLIFSGENYYKKSIYYLENGDVIKLFKNQIIFTTLVKIYKDKDYSIVTHETKDGYIPIIIGGKILYENLEFLMVYYSRYL